MSALGQKQTCAAQKPVPIANGQRHLVCAEDGTFQKGYAGDDLSGGDAPCWEIVMRSLAVPVMLIGIFGLSVSSFARDVSIGKHTAEEVKSVCDKVGGKFSQDATGHYCGTNCRGGPGTDCVVGCKTGQPCFAQVIGSRRPTTLANALQALPGSPR